MISRIDSCIERCEGGQAISAAASRQQKACTHPGSQPTRQTIRDELASVAANKAKCASIYLDTVDWMSNGLLSTEGEDHHQGLARTHRLSDGAIYFFLSHAEPDTNDKGFV